MKTLRKLTIATIMLSGCGGNNHTSQRTEVQSDHVNEWSGKTADQVPNARITGTGLDGRGRDIVVPQIDCAIPKTNMSFVNV